MKRSARPSRARPLWKCRACGRSFANRNQSHACGKLDLARHFEGRSPAVRTLYELFLRSLRDLGPVRVLPEKTRIAFQTRMSFAQLTPRKTFLVGHLVLAKASASGKFRKVETISLRNHVHHFRLESADFIDAEFRSLMAQAYAVGNQEHLASRGRNAKSPGAQP